MSRRSATRETSRRITRAARDLAGEHGLDGFTMDELAAAAGVSRRTLFNHFPGKVDAVLGPAARAPAAALERFQDGGPTGQLIPDLRALAEATLEDEELAREEVGRVRALLLANPKLLAATHARLLTLCEALVAQVERREGPSFDRLRARVAIAVLGAVFDAALDAFLADTRHTFAHHVDRSIRLARELFG